MIYYKLLLDFILSQLNLVLRCVR